MNGSRSVHTQHATRPAFAPARCRMASDRICQNSYVNLRFEISNLKFQINLTGQRILLAFG